MSQYSSRGMVYHYAVRITHSYEVCKALVDTWSLRCEKMLVYEHIGSVTEKVHIHLIMEGSDTHKKWLRELGQRTGVNLKGNKYCSFKEFDGNKTAMVYMTKGVHEPSYNKGYSLEDIALWKSQWVDHPKSKDAALYEHIFGSEEYNDEMYENWTKENPKDDKDVTMSHKFKWVKSEAYKAALMHNGFIVNMKTINQYKMLVYSYCARYGIWIPDEDKVFKRLG